MKRIKEYTTQIRSIFNNYHHNQCYSFYIVVLALLSMIFLCRPKDTYAQTPLKVFVNADRDTVFVLNEDGGFNAGRLGNLDSQGATSVAPTARGEHAMARFDEAVFHGAGSSFPHFFSKASAASADGSTVVGRSNSENGSEAFLWTEDRGMIGLGDLPGGTFSSVAFDVSADGSIVVGRSNTDGGFPFGYEAFVWTEEEGMQNLAELVEEEYGAAYNGWVFAEATGVGIAGGDTIVVTGHGMNPLGLQEGFRIPLTGFGTVADEASSEVPINMLNAPSPNPVHETAPHGCRRRETRGAIRTNRLSLWNQTSC